MLTDDVVIATRRADGTLSPPLSWCDGTLYKYAASQYLPRVAYGGEESIFGHEASASCPKIPFSSRTLGGEAPARKRVDTGVVNPLKKEGNPR